MEEGLHDGDNFDRAEEVSIAELSPRSRVLLIYRLDIWLYRSIRNSRSLLRERLLLERESGNWVGRRMKLSFVLDAGAL